MIGEQFGVGVVSAFEGIAFQDPVAESVDGENGGAVEIHQRPLDSPQEGGDVVGRIFAGLGDGAGDAGIGGGGWILQRVAGLDQHLAQAVAEFPRGGFGEGHNQDLLDGQAHFQHEAEIGILDVVGFAGAGAGFHECAVVRIPVRKNDVGKLGHGYSPPCSSFRSALSMGSMMRRARSAKTASS